MSRNRGVVCAILAVATLVFVACPPLLNTENATTDGSHRFIKLSIDAPHPSRSITVSEYQVTGLKVEVRDPDGVSIQTITWDANQGPRTYMVPIKTAGRHQIEVTHFGEKNGETVEATETAEFTIGAMVITVVEIVPGNVGLIKVAGELVDPLAWLYGDWIGDRTARPYTDVLTLNPDRTFTTSDNYDGSGVGWIGSGTWSYENGIFTIETPAGPMDVELTKITDNQFSVIIPDGEQDMYRKGTQPGGWVFDLAPIALTLSGVDEWIQGDLPAREVALYDFQAPAAGDYLVSWKETGDPFDPQFSADILVSAYDEDQVTPFFVQQENGYSSPQLITLSEGETIYILVDAAYGGGTFGIGVRQ